MPEPTTAEVSQDESYEAYEQRFLAERSGSANAADTSDAAADDDSAASKTASESETEDDNEQDDEKDEEGKDDGKPAKRGGFQRRIDKLTTKIKDLESQLAAKPAAQATNEPAKTEPEAPKFDKAKPKLEDFESIEQYTEALTDWKLESKEFDRNQKAAQEAAQKEAQTLIESWNTRVADAKSAHRDYDAVMEAAKDIAISPAHQRLFLESEHGAAIAYDLAKDHAELKKFAAMPPLAAARYFGKLEAAVGDAPAQTKKPTATRAPRPPATVGSRGAVRSADPTDEALANDYSAWEAARNAQLRKRRG